MSGHSKWANIKRKKQANDLVRGNLFSKLSRLITIAVLEGGGTTDPENNIRLRLAIEKAHISNMPKENISRAIERGIGPDKAQLKEIIYEVFAPSGIVIVILATTDNPNRTLSEIRNHLEKHEGKLGNQGSVLYLFKKCGKIIFKKSEATEKEVLSFVEMIKAFDIDEDDNHFTVYFSFESLGKIKDYLRGLKYEIAEVDYKPNSLIELKDKVKEQKILSLVESLEELDDVQKVFTNLKIGNEHISSY